MKNLIATSVLIAGAGLVGAQPAQDDCARLFRQLFDTKPGPGPKIGRVGGADEVLIIDPAQLDAATAARLKERAAHFVFGTRKGTDIAERLLGAPVKKVDVWAVVPTDDAGVRRVFGLPVEADVSRASRQLQKASVQWKEVGGARVVSTRLEGSKPLADRVMTEIASGDGPGNLSILFGHNRNGVFSFPDGSELSIDALSQALRNRKGYGVLLTCDTLGAGLDEGVLTARRLEFDLTARALKRTQVEFRSADGRDLRAFLGALERNLQDEATREGMHTKIVAGATGGLILSVAIVGIIGDDDDEE